MKFFQSKGMRYSDKVLEAILEELKNIHYHVERVEVFTMMAHNIKENKKGVWIEEENVKNKKDKTSD